MGKLLLAVVAAFSLTLQAVGQELEQESDTAASAAEDAQPANDSATTDNEQEQGPKTMSGMSILGNEEAPKSLVIIPWKSSELGEDISLSNTLDDRAQPVDRDVFLRELRFYKIRSAE